MFTEIPATLQARNVQCKDGFVVEQYMEILRLSNDEWTMFTCSPLEPDRNSRWTPGVVDYGARYTQIVSADLSRTWTIQHSSFDYSVIDRPDALMVPFHWGVDGKHLYLYPSYYPGPSGFPDSAVLRSHIQSLYRINLDTGDFGPFLDRGQFGDLAFSPDDRYIVFSDPETPDELHVRTVDTGREVQIRLDEDVVAAGAFTWNADSTKVVLFAGHGRQTDNWQEDLSGTSIFVLTPSSIHVQRVLANDPRTFIPYRCSDSTFWQDETTICLYSTNEDLDSWNKIFTFNITTGHVELLRPFP